MTEERLQLLPEELLRTIAKKEGVLFSNNIDKQDLIDLIIEAIEEDRDENKLLDNPAMQIKEKKFDITLNEQYYFEEDKYPLPEKYHETKIVLLLRDPAWAFTYWEIRDDDLSFLGNDKKRLNLFLRVYELKSAKVTPESIFDYLDVPVSISDNSWYINLHRPGVYYCIELYLSIKNSNKPLCRSNIVKSPMWEIDVDTDFKDYKGLGNDLNYIAGIYDLSPNEAEGKIPQRIISMIDAEYLE